MRYLWSVQEDLLQHQAPHHQDLSPDLFIRSQTSLGAFVWTEPPHQCAPHVHHPERAARRPDNTIRRPAVVSGRNQIQ